MTRNEDAFNNLMDDNFMDATDEFMRSTCLDRARIALLATGQVHCAMIMRGLQERFDTIGAMMEIDSNKPGKILDEMYDAMLTWNIFYDEDGEKRDGI